MSTLFNLPLPTAITMNSAIVLPTSPGEKSNHVLSSPCLTIVHTANHPSYDPVSLVPLPSTHCFPSPGPLWGPCLHCPWVVLSPICNWSPQYSPCDLAEIWRTPSPLHKAFLCLPLSLGTKPITPTTALKGLQFGVLTSISLCFSLFQVLALK